MKIQKLLILASILFFTLSCHTKKAVTEDSSNVVSEASVLKRMAKNRISKQWMSAQSKIQLESNQMNIGGIANIRMIKDSLIWMNVKKFGFEAGRVLITKDSVFVLNRLNKSYIAENISSLISMVKGIPDELSPLMNLKGLQDILLGNPVLLPVKKFEITPIENQYKLYGKTLSGIQTGYWVQAVGFLLDKMNFSDTSKQIDVISEYNEYQTIGNIDFSTKRTLKLSKKEQFYYNIFLELYNIEFDTPKPIKFDIPSRYSKMDL